MGIRERLSGNEAVAYAMKQINPDVMGAYPITPSTEIPQYFSTYVDNGEVDTLFIAVESEHSAMSTCIGAENWEHRGMVFFPDACFYEFIPEQEMRRNLEEPDYQPRTLSLIHI